MLHRFFLKTAQVMAYLGGVMLAGLVIMTCLSVLGRSLNGALHGDLAQSLMPGFADTLLGLGIGPVTGDFELIEAGIAFAIFAFIPYCQITGGHASVDIFTSRLSGTPDRLLRMLTEVVFAAVLVLIAVQMCAGMISKWESGQTTLLLQYPVWWGYALSLTGAVVAACIGVYLACLRCAELVSGQHILPADPGAEP